MTAVLWRTVLRGLLRFARNDGCSGESALIASEAKQSSRNPNLGIKRHRERSEANHQVVS